MAFHLPTRFPWWRSLALRLLVLCLAILAGAAIVLVSTLHGLRGVDGLAGWINRAGHSRLESFEIVAAAHRARLAAPAEAPAELAGLRARLATVDRTLLALRDGDPAADLQAAPTPAIREAVEAARQRWAADVVPAAGAAAGYASPDALERLYQVAGEHVARVDVAVSAAEAVADARVGRALALEAVLAVGVLLAFTLAAGFARELMRREAGAAREAEQAQFARLGAMAAVIAHEVRNPLAGISATVQLLASRAPQTAALKEAVEEIHARIEALDLLVGDMLAYARPRALALAAQSLRGCATAAAATLARRPSAAGVQVDIAGPDVAVRADGEQLAQALTCLLMNAAQAMDGHGTVRVSLQQTDGHAAVTVADGGPGIPAAVRERLFEPFHTTKIHGTGLGLPIVKRIAEAHGARVAVECPPGGGTRVTIEGLPVTAVA